MTAHRKCASVNDALNLSFPSVWCTLPHLFPRQRCGVGPGDVFLPGGGRALGLAPRAGWGRAGMEHSSRVYR